MAAIVATVTLALTPTEILGRGSGIFQTGTASFYGPGFNGRKAASGERFNQNAMTAAHKTLPFDTNVKVTLLKTGKSVCVRINDRGPYHGGRIIDLSQAAAIKLGMYQAGTGKVSLAIGC